MTAEQSSECRKLSVDLVKDNPNKLKNHIIKTSPASQETLDNWIPDQKNNKKLLEMDREINWPRLIDAYEIQPKDYEELISISGIGPATVRALALIGELIYGVEPSWQDPVKYTFTVGGKDGVPYPVDKKVMDETTEILKQGIQEAKVGDRDKIGALQRLRRFVPEDVVV
jgi:hypothetical protein